MSKFKLGDLVYLKRYKERAIILEGACDGEEWDDECFPEYSVKILGDTISWIAEEDIKLIKKGHRL